MQARRILRDRFIPHLALVFLLLGLLAVASHAQTFSPPLQLNANGMDPRMAVDTNGNINVVWHHLLDSGVWFTRSTDGGATFSTPTLIPGIPARNSSNLQIAVDSSDAIHVLATASVRTAPGHSVEEIFYAHSSNGGATFSVTSIANGETYILWGPLMAVAPSGSVNILWIPLDPLQPGPSTGLKLSVSRSTDGGATFSTTAVWNWPDSAGIMGGDKIVVDANEDIYVAWHYCLGSQPCNLLFSRSTDQGKTYSSPTVLGSGANPEMVIDSSGNLDLAWVGSATWFTRSTNQGATFATPTPISASAVTPRMAVDPKGDIFIALNGFLSRSTDGGATFSPPSHPGNLAGISEIAVDSGGNIDIAGGAGNGTSQIVFVRSIDAGNTFSSQTPISDDPTHLCVAFSEMALEKGADIDVVWYQWPRNFGQYPCDFSSPISPYFSRGIVPNFKMSAAPGTQSLLPGGAGKFTVTLTATGGFSDAVNLSCTKLPAGAECAFDSSSITPKDSGSQATLTVTTPPTLAQGNYSVTITAASGGLQHTQDVQIVVGGISGSVTPSSATIAVGSSANFAVSLRSSAGFSGPVNLACGGAPSGISCSFAPAQVSVAANAGATSTLTVQVAAKPSVSMTPRAPHNGPGPSSYKLLPLMTLGVALLLAVFVFGVILGSLQRLKNLSAGERHNAVRGGLFRMTRWWNVSAAGLAALALVLVLAVGLVSCGGATKSSTASGTATSSGSGGSGATGGTGGSGGTGGTGGSGSGGTGGTGGTSITTQFAVQAQSDGATVNLGTVSVTVP